MGRQQTPALPGEQQAPYHRIGSLGWRRGHHGKYVGVEFRVDDGSVADSHRVAGRREPLREVRSPVVEGRLVEEFVAGAIDCWESINLPAVVARVVAQGLNRPTVRSEVAGVPLGVQVGALKSDGDCHPGDVFLDAVFDSGAVPGGLPVHPDVPVDRSKRVGDTGRDSHTVHAVVPGGSLRACDMSDNGGAGFQVDGVDQHLVDAVSAVGREVGPTVVTPRRPERPGGDSVVRSVGFGEVDNPGTGRVVVPVDGQSTVRPNAHGVGALAVTEINPDGGDV